VSVALLRIEHLGVRYALPTATWSAWRRRTLDALADVSLELEAGCRLGVVGESGSGKSTLARVVLGLVRARTGRVLWDGTAVDYGDGAALRALRRELQVVFQDPVGSLDPRMTAGEAVAEALSALEGLTSRRAVQERVAASLVEVGLDPDLAARYPHQLSGGQCQRVAIARATVVRPRLLICDEAVSALDVSVQAQIVNLLRDLSERHQMALLFISHNLAVVRHLCDEIVVLREGRVVERAARDDLFRGPRASYTQSLLDAVPIPDPVVQRARLAAAVAEPAAPGLSSRRA
jgi:ABC-type glutathione transport system ATPase component